MWQIVKPRVDAVESADATISIHDSIHKSLKQNASLKKVPTRTATTRRNHLFTSLCAYVKLERLKSKTKLSHFALKSKLYLSEVKSAHAELVNLEEQFVAA